MEHIITNSIAGAGEFEYYLTKTFVGSVATYGIAIKNIRDCHIETVNDIWTEKTPVLKFILLIAKNQVTCTHLKELCEEFVEELYSM